MCHERVSQTSAPADDNATRKREFEETTKRLRDLEEQQKKIAENLNNMQSMIATQQQLINENNKKIAEQRAVISNKDSGNNNVMMDSNPKTRFESKQTYDNPNVKKFKAMNSIVADSRNSAERLTRNPYSSFANNQNSFLSKIIPKNNIIPESRILMDSDNVMMDSDDEYTSLLNNNVMMDSDDIIMEEMKLGIVNMHIELINFHRKKLQEKIKAYEKDSLYVEKRDNEKQVIRTDYTLENRSNLISGRFYSEIVDTSNIFKDTCNRCNVYSWSCELTCGHKICIDCYNKNMTKDYKIECGNCHRTTYNITILNAYMDIIGYKFIRVARIKNNIRVLGDIGAIVTLQIPTFKNNLYYSKVDSRWNPSKDGYKENTKYAAQKVIVLGVQFFGYDMKELATTIKDYHDNRCILVLSLIHI
jgi:hypothetical protein